jgi:signal transduction histidine kinase
MYAELLQENMSDAQEKARGHLDVIVSESRRLSRMIGNVLTFSRQQKQGLSLRYTRGIPDDVIRAVIENFRPAFESHGILAEFAAGAGEEVGFDRDALEQILGNLFSNVEKYAADGKSVKVVSEVRDGRIVVTVSDRGTGIAEAQREKIFAPFYRVSNKLTDGITGTGIGLTIARELARMHGGDLRLLESDTGATFEVTLKIQDGGHAA